VARLVSTLALGDESTEGRLAALVHGVMQLHDQAQALHQRWGSALTTREAALLRLCSSGSRDDEQLLQVPVAGARLLHVVTTRSREVVAIKGVLAAAAGPDCVVVLVRDTVGRADGRARRIAARVVALDASATVGISSPVLSSQDVPRAAREAASACAMGRDADCSITSADDQWHELLLGRLRPVLQGCGPVDRLLDYDREHGSDLLTTLSAWLASGNEAAAELNIHVNTLRYRVRRAAEISGVDLDDPRQRLALTVMLTA